MQMETHIPAGDGRTLEGDLVVPGGARGLVIFAHGSGSSRWSPRNRQVARVLERSGLATLLLDLLTMEEERIDAISATLRFDIGLLAARVSAALDWVGWTQALGGLEVGLFGSSTGAAAALVAAADRPDRVRAVVSRGGRPDLAEERLAEVRAPTLFIVGGDDTAVLRLNRRARGEMERAETRLEVIPGATHLFEEPGALEQVAEMAAEFFLEQLAGARPGAAPPPL